MSTLPVGLMSATEYLAWERDQKDKHQLLGGHVYAMAGGSPRHNQLSANVSAELRGALRGGPCRPFSSGQKVFVPVTGNFVYPTPRWCAVQSCFALDRTT